MTRYVSAAVGVVDAEMELRFGEGDDGRWCGDELSITVLKTDAPRMT